jgi:hypothetical protein
MMIPKAKKKAKKVSRKTIINKLDKLMSEQIRARGMCERCGRKANEVQLQCAHIYSRSYKHLRWDPENLLCLCSGCHFWWHLNPVEAIIWVGGIKDLKYLAKMRQNTTPIKDWQLVELYDELKGSDKN